MAALNAVITGWGFYVPPKVLTNQDLEHMVDTTDAWIVERTGVRERHIVGDDEATAGMSVKAARRALERAGVAGLDLDAIIVATTTPDYLLPTAAAMVQQELGAEHAAIFDLGAACAGWIYGLAVARGLVAAGTARTILLVGAETISRFVDWTDRATCVLFGDGAGAVVIEASNAGAGIQSTVLRGDGRAQRHLWVKGGGSRYPPGQDGAERDRYFIKMNGQEVFKLAVPSMARAAEQALAEAGLRLADVDLLIPHQANLRIIEAVGKRLRLDPTKIFVNIQQYGNTSAASIPIALAEAVEAGRVWRGDTLVFCAFGGGMTWAAAVVEWCGPLRGDREELIERARERVEEIATTAREPVAPSVTSPLTSWFGATRSRTGATDDACPHRAARGPSGRGADPGRRTGRTLGLSPHGWKRYTRFAAAARAGRAEHLA